MRVDTKTPEAVQKTATAPIAETQQEFNWQQCWYPVTFVQDLPTDRPYSFSLYDEPLVLFRNQDGKLACLTNRCPHRAAKLSDGQIIDGKIECLYHGWQFGQDGQCLHIPQLPEDAKIPAKACVPSFTVVERQGIVWVWMGKSEAADIEGIPTVADLENPTVASSDYMIDLPYDQTYFIENALDPSHLFISHEGTLSSRKYAQPLEMEVLESSTFGIRGRYRKTRQKNSPWVNLDFVAPNLVTYKSSSGEKSVRIGGAALYSLPLGKGKCRIIIRNYKNYSFWKLKLQPRWMEHWYRDKFLEEDLPLVVGQQAEVERLGTSLKSLYLPLKTSDLLLIEYRKWLDKFGTSLPFYQGYSTRKLSQKESEDNQQPAPLDRLRRHTQICGSCNRAYQVTNRLKTTFVGVAIALAALAIVTDGSGTELVAILGSGSAVVIATVAHQVKTHFERSYTRH
ncbi:Rieske 2Fe-2S domain-containing protein [Moorena sp. SIO3I6]|uniref:aromatic ring-hydroxylating dioxygenase subunit alpha n=1 Tax=Moorena sp. SIO3I6 TaxID=2607831 RepID=UPI0013F9797F|nr:Rieske 2Fe-2S domain-containing protein [Moorena sp. SIO3I6]NEP20995.1 Rieske 2Fe-2S domain-containing protein [Moorena sp. SIO3I6]